MGKQTLQHFELHVLLAMLRERGETYSVPLVVALEKRMERPVAQAAVFIALEPARKQGTGRRPGSTSATAARSRRYFQRDQPGLAAIKENRLEHERLWRGLGRVLSVPKA